MEKKLPKSLIEFIESHRPIKFKKNEIIQSPGDLLDSGLYLKSGYIRVYTVCKDGQEVTLHVIRPHTLVNCFLFPENTKSQYYLEAFTSVELYRLPKEEVLGHLFEDKEGFEATIGNTLSDYREIIARVESLASGNAYSKVVSTLAILTDGRKKTNVSFDFPVTHRLIASMTGLTRETVTLQMLKLKKKGLITGKGKRMVIADLGKLQEEDCSVED
jgi:CRP-like cAMP-binding protein